MRKDRIHSKILLTKEYFQQSENVEKRDSPDGEEESGRETLKTFLFI